MIMVYYDKKTFSYIFQNVENIVEEKKVLFF